MAERELVGLDDVSYEGYNLLLKVSVSEKRSSILPLGQMASHIWLWSSSFVCFSLYLFCAIETLKNAERMIDMSAPAILLQFARSMLCKQYNVVMINGI